MPEEVCFVGEEGELGQMSLQLSNLCCTLNLSPSCLEEGSESSVYLVPLSQVKTDPDHRFDILFHSVQEADDFRQTSASLSLETSRPSFLIVQPPFILILDMDLAGELSELIAACFVVVVKSLSPLF
jgi:hypothetical protein